MKRYRVLLLWVLLFCVQAFVFAQTGDPSLLTLDRIFNSEDFNRRASAGFGGSNRATLIRSSNARPTVQGGMDLVSYDAATNKRDGSDRRRKTDSEGRNRSLCRLTATNGRRTTSKC